MAVRSYQLTRPGPKHFRKELSDGTPVTKTVQRNSSGYFEPIGGIQRVGYGVGPGLRNVIKLDEKDVHKFAHFRPQIIIEARAEETEPKVKVPADWSSLPASDRKALAAQIAGDDDNRRVREADEIIQEYLSRGSEPNAS